MVKVVVYFLMKYWDSKGLALEGSNFQRAVE